MTLWNILIKCGAATSDKWRVLLAAINTFTLAGLLHNNYSAPTLSLMLWGVELPVLATGPLHLAPPAQLCTVPTPQHWSCLTADTDTTARDRQYFTGWKFQNQKIPCLKNYVENDYHWSPVWIFLMIERQTLSSITPWKCIHLCCNKIINKIFSYL